jgi:hypothetical protein
MKRRWALLLLCAAAEAAIVPRLSLEQLVDQSEVIVHGRVARSWVEWDRAHKYIWTHHEIEVIDPIRGAASASVVASEPGGRLDGIEMKFSGALQYSVGEEAVLFLYRTPIGYWRATGFGQGKYTVQPDTRVHSDLRGLDLIPSAAATSGLDGLTVTEFKTRLRGMLRRK